MAPSFEEPAAEAAAIDLKPQVKTTTPQLVAPEPEHCPGPESNQAGKTDACAGCPNQQICATATPKGPDPDIPLIAARLVSVRHKILVLSGKGGVGKSTFAVLLARGLTSVKDGNNKNHNGDGNANGNGNGNGNGHHDSNDDNNDDSFFGVPAEGSAVTVGLMDADICGPSVPKMVGVETETIHVSADGLQPVWADDNLCVMSVQFMLPGRDDAVVWRGAKKNGLIKKFLRDVEWGELDYLVVDTPPGTSDEHLTVAAMLREAASLSSSMAMAATSNNLDTRNNDINNNTITTTASSDDSATAKGLDGAILITTPQEVSLLDVRKEIDFCRKAGIRILGLVENMSGFVCPNCRHETQIFRPSTGGAEKLAEDTGVRFLGRVPLDPRVGMACDYGESLFENYPDSKVCGAIEEVVRKVVEIL